MSPTLTELKSEAYTKFLTGNALVDLTEQDQALQLAAADASPNIARYVHRHARATPRAVALLIPEIDPGSQTAATLQGGWKECTWDILSDFIADLTFKWADEIGYAEKGSRAPVAAVVVSPAEDMLAPSLALISLGYSIAPINPHLSTAAIAHLVGLANASVIVCSSSPGSASAVSARNLKVHVLEESESLGARVRTRKLNPSDDVTADIKMARAKVKEMSECQVVREPAYWLHSSGTTGLPKLVPWRNSALFAQIRPVVDFMNQEEGEQSGRIMFLTKELFAVIPIGICLKSMYIGKGWTIAFPREPILQQTVEGLLQDMIDVKATDISVYTCDAAAFIRYLETPPKNAVQAEKQHRYGAFLRQLGPIPCGGSRIDRGMMAKAIQLGIQIQSTFGTTESGACLISVPSFLDGYWGKVFKDSPVPEEIIDTALAMVPIPFFHAVFEAQGSDANLVNSAGEVVENPQEYYELVLDTRDPVFSTSSVGENGKWRTRDLFRKIVRKETGMAMYVFETRKDDMVMLGNGGSIFPARIEEKVSDAISPLFELLGSADLVDRRAHADRPNLASRIEILLVGAGRAFPALLIEGASSKAAQQLVRNGWTEHGAKINESFPAYSPLKFELFYFLKADETLPRTVKNTVSRKKAEQQFKGQLDVLYNALP